MDQAQAQRVLNHGFELQKMGRVQDAAVQYQKVLKAFPKQPDALHLLGAIIWQNGNPSKGRSMIKKSIALQPKSPHFLLTLGQLETESGQYGSAIKAITRSISLQPDLVEAMTLLADVYHQVGNYEGCVTSLRRVIELAPDHLRARFLLSQMPNNLVPMVEGLAHISHAVELQPKNPMLLAEKALRLERANQLDAARETVQKALSIDPNTPTARFVAGQLFFRDGDLEQAEDALIGLEGSRALFSLGLILDRKGDHPRAFKAFSEAHADALNDPIWQSMEKGAYPSMVKGLVKWMDNAPILSQARPEDDLKTPIFLIGFVRSGTTLVEQALASIPNLVGSGEKLSMDTLIADIPDILGRKVSYPELLETLSAEDIEKLRAYYWREARNKLGDEALEGRLVDKQPMNLVHLPLIRLLFPDSKVIFIQRDPRDIVLSCYMQSFVPNVLTRELHDIDNIANLFIEVMTLWSLYAGSFEVMSISYEELVEDFEGILRDVVAYIEEPWTDDVMNYAQTSKKSVVSTASYRDVTSPIFKRSVRRWENYREELASVLPLLADW